MGLLRVAIADELKQISVWIKEIHAIVIAPIDRRRSLDACRRKPFFGVREVIGADPERVMSAAQRIRDQRGARLRGQRGAGDFEQRKILSPALEQDLVAEMRGHLEAEHPGIEALGARQIGNFESKMIQPRKFHHRPDPGARIL